MILIHTALLCEAQCFIEYYKLKKINSSPKIYTNNKIIICVSGIGKINTQSSLQYIYDNYSITKAINIGIAGCNNHDITIGELFCTNQELQEIKYLPLITSDSVVTNSDIETTTLYDMEAKYFADMSTAHLNKHAIYIFKIVSDYLDSQILKKDFIKNLIAKKQIIHQFI